MQQFPGERAIVAMSAELVLERLLLLGVYQESRYAWYRAMQVRLNTLEERWARMSNVTDRLKVLAPGRSHPVLLSS